LLIKKEQTKVSFEIESSVRDNSDYVNGDGNNNETELQIEH
jgi:hypothetical protein